MTTEHDKTNPNFPLNLNIHPSSNLITNPASNTDDLDANFGVAAQQQAIQQYGIAGRVWEAAYALIYYTHPPDNLEFDPPFIDSTRHERYTMMELGSGSGLVASVIARLLQPGRDQFIATDLPEPLREVCPLLESNLQPTNADRMSDQLEDGMLFIRPLSWGNIVEAENLATSLFDGSDSSFRIGTLTHIICCDLVYFPELLAPLLRSLLHVTSPPFASPAASASPEAGPLVYLSYKMRSLAKETTFWSAFGLWFDYRPVLVKNRSESSFSHWTRFGADFDDPTFLFVGHRRPESYEWKISSLDEDLLGGVGVHNSDSRKGDDTFENLLMMLVDQ